MFRKRLTEIDSVLFSNLMRFNFRNSQWCKCIRISSFSEVHCSGY